MKTKAKSGRQHVQASFAFFLQRGAPFCFFFAFSLFQFRLFCFDLILLVHMKALPVPFPSLVWLIMGGDAFSLFLMASISLVMAVLVLCRFSAQGPVASFRSNLAALCGWLSPLLFAFVPLRFDTPFSVRLFADFLLVLGGIGSLFVLRFLGRSFSVLPSARCLVRDGPYRFSRHPLYLAELLLSAGIALRTFSWSALLVFLLVLFFQILRARIEETQLRKVFSPDYDLYAAKTGFFFPRFFQRRP